jgi:hypothetical protein
VVVLLLRGAFLAALFLEALFFADFLEAAFAIRVPRESAFIGRYLVLNVNCLAKIKFKSMREDVA